MRLIAHRGNYKGKDEARENSIPHLLDAIDQGYDVETDIYYQKGFWFLGHDFPKYPVSREFLERLSPYTWFHAKNYITFCELLNNRFHCFFHGQDEYALTSNRIIWAYSGKYISNEYASVAVMPESCPGYEVPSNIYGVCSDDLRPFRDKLSNTINN